VEGLVGAPDGLLFLKSTDDSTVEDGPVNGRMLKHYLDPAY